MHHRQIWADPRIPETATLLERHNLSMSLTSWQNSDCSLHRTGYCSTAEALDHRQPLHVALLVLTARQRDARESVPAGMQSLWAWEHIRWVLEA